MADLFPEQTGMPKGTLIAHEAFCSGAQKHGPAMLMSSESRVLQFAAHTFDASLVGQPSLENADFLAIRVLVNLRRVSLEHRVFDEA